MNIHDFIRKEIDKNIDLKYLKFHSSLVPNINTIKGVRIPKLRNIAKFVSKRDDILYYLDNPKFASYEELTVYGLVIGYSEMNIVDYLKYLKKFVPYIDNWATCDTVVSNLKFTGKNLDYVYPLLLKYLNSTNEFEVRFSIVMFINYYINDNYIDKILNNTFKIKHDGYYAKMAIAWFISVCYIKYQEKTLNFLKSNTLDKWVYNKSIQKILESNRVPFDEKILIHKLKI